MDYNFTALPYERTSSFSPIIIDYLNGNENLKSFYAHMPSREGILQAIREREKFSTNRDVLVQGLAAQYRDIEVSEAVKINLEKLKQPNCFTVTTAHQPALFTGPLYFIYKILHTIKLAQNLKESHPDKDFVPVFFMGSEDADSDELCHFYLGEDKIIWDHGQTGAVGRMENKNLEPLFTRIAYEISALPKGKEILEILRSSYLPGENIQIGTLKLLNSLFGEYGLIIYIPDNSIFKQQMHQVFADDLFHHSASGIVHRTIEALEKKYKVQAHPREINLFYLENDKRERIEQKGDFWHVLNTGIKFTREGLENALRETPEKFSPNVILRGIMQEMTLPNIAFIGGGGELAYWLELKEVFEYYKVPYPVLILRNSFLLIESRWKALRLKLNIGVEELFEPVQALEKKKIEALKKYKLNLQDEQDELKKFFDRLTETCGESDPTLKAHVQSILRANEKKLSALEKKLLKVAKMKEEAILRQIGKLKSALFPHGKLQERVENFIPYYALYGEEWLQMLLHHSFTTEQQFGIIEINK